MVQEKYIFTFWKNVLDKINSASITGILVKILGIKEPKVIYPRISFHAVMIQHSMKLLVLNVGVMLNMDVLDACIILEKVVNINL